MSRMQDAVREVMDTLESKANAQAISGTMTEHAIKDIVSENLALREDEAKLCYSIVGKYTAEFFEWLQSLSIEPFIKEIYSNAMECASVETKRVIEKGYIPKEYEEQALKMNEQVLKRFLHDVTKRIREASHDTEADTLMEAMKYLCECDEDSDTPKSERLK